MRAFAFLAPARRFTAGLRLRSPSGAETMRLGAAWYIERGAAASRRRGERIRPGGNAQASSRGLPRTIARCGCSSRARTSPSRRIRTQAVHEYGANEAICAIFVDQVTSSYIVGLATLLATLLAALLAVLLAALLLTAALLAALLLTAALLAAFGLILRHCRFLSKS